MCPDPLLRNVEHPSRYLGGEFGLPRPVPDPRLNVLLGFPDLYEVGMSHLGLRLLHASLLQRGDIGVERVFLPWPDLQQRLLHDERPLGAIESGRPAEAFDLIGLSVQYELAYPAVVKLLDLMRLPRLAQERQQRRTPMPLILVGGAAALNPEPLAPFVDAFFVGEADEAIHEIVEALCEVRHEPLVARLARLATIEGIYVPELVQPRFSPEGAFMGQSATPPQRLPVRRRVVADLEALPIPSIHLVPTCTLVHDRVTVEIQRGCSQGCRFCQAGFIGRPTRQRRADTVIRAARRLLAQTGYQDLALLSLSAGDHPELQAMLAALIEEHGPNNIAVSLPSLRTETLHPTVAQKVQSIRQNTFTLAPEAATSRLRQVINKQNTDLDLERAVENVVKAGFGRLKLYFMIGLPTEEDADVLAIASLSRQVLQRALQVRGSASLTVSISTFVPKPHTPLQWEAAPDRALVEHRLELLRGAMPRRIRLRWHDPGQSLIEAYLARGARTLSRVLDRVVTRDHSGLDAWTEHFRMDRWMRAMSEAEEAGEAPSLPSSLGVRDPAAVLPWDHLDLGVERRYLELQRQAALDGVGRPDCTDGTCDACGVCPEAPLHRLAEAQIPEAGPAEPPQAEAPEADPRRLRVPTRPRYVRVWFHKLQPVALVGHLEMMALFERAARRAGLPLAFSGGYNPKARLRFTPALPLGSESLCEFVEIGLLEDLDPAQVMARLAPQLPDGFALMASERAEDDRLARICGIRWRIVSQPPLDAQDLEQARLRLHGEPLVLTRGRRPGRSSSRPGRDLCRIVIALLQPAPDHLEIHCRFDETGTAKPEEVLRSLFGFSTDNTTRYVRVIRAGWLLVDPKEAAGEGPPPTGGSADPVEP